MTATEFVQRPTRVTAMQILEGSVESWLEVEAWITGFGEPPDSLGHGHFQVPGVHYPAGPGDWVVRVDEGFEVMSAGEFAHRYLELAAAEECPMCGASTLEHRHAMSIPLVQGLIKLAEAGGGPINLRELELTRNQWDNFQKLRYFVLVRQVSVEGKRQRGVWEITEGGRAFLTGRVTCPRVVWTFRGKPTRSSEETVRVGDVLPGYQQREDWAQTALPMEVPQPEPDEPDDEDDDDDDEPDEGDGPT